ncbi:MAG: hypothetical protein GQ468_05310 [Candidatus Scalindua sp.]|nr:hypothetical protein [Candidatus Scalindua sp.]
MGLKSNDIISGYKYHLGIHLVLCHGPVDALKKIIIGDREAWTGTATGGTITVTDLELFGGEKREGGVDGDVEILMGGAAQGQNAYLQDVLETNDIPAFRGLFALLFKQFYYSTNPYLKPFKIQAKRTDIHNDGSTMWYLAKSTIGTDMNPAHIIYECLTDKQWGMKYEPNVVVDDAIFQAVADILFTEGMGLSYLWSNSEQIGQFIQNVLNTISAVLRQNLTTGLLELKLIRNDYVIASLPVLDESNIIKLKTFQRSSWDETVNEVTVVYHDEVDDQDKPAVVQDLGNIQIQGRVVPKTLQMPGISNEAHAIKVALRETRASATPLSSVSLVANRAAWALNNGDVFKFNWPKLGIVDVVYRISKVNEDNLKKGDIYIEAVEDVFATPDAVYSEPQTPQWVDPKSNPSDVTNWEIHEATYWDVQFNLTAADIANLGATDNFVGVSAARNTNDAFAYDVLARVSPAAYENVGVGPFCPSAVITPALVVQNDTTFAYTGGSAMLDVTVGKYAYINLEIVKVTAINLGGSTVTVARGILDTTPLAHTAGSRIYFSEDRQGVDRTERTFGETVDVKLLPQTPLGVLAEGSATSKNWFMNQHRQRPYPPGDFRIEGAVYPSTSSGDIVVTWNHRDRTQQLAYLVEQDEANIGPETNVDYFVRVYDGGSQVHDSGSVAGTQYVYTQAQRITDFGGVGPHTVEVRVWAKNDTISLNSMRFHKHIFTANDV